MNSLEMIDLITEATNKLNPYKTVDGRLHGDVSAAVLAKNGAVYTGVCVDTPSWGICAERSAIAAMIADGCYQIDTIVAVWRNPETNKVHILPPCGGCREFMRNIDEANLHAHVIVGKSESVPLKDLIPYHKWPASVDD